MEFKNLKRNIDGSIDGDWIQEDGTVKRYTLDAAMGHIEQAESGEWGEIEEPTQAEKDAESKIDMIRQADQTFNETMSPIVNSVSQLERDTWLVQEQEARAWMVDPTVETPFIYMLASSRGVDIETLVHKIIAKADVYSSMLAKALGEKHKAEDNV